MTDRVYLEQAEAREMLFNYNHQKTRNGPVISRQWLEVRINHLAKIYGHGFSERVRGYMRDIADSAKHDTVAAMHELEGLA
jgi:hypothetical protein